MKATDQERTFLQHSAVPALRFVGPRPELSATQLRDAVQAAHGEAQSRLARFLDSPAQDTLRNNWQELFCTRATIAEFDCASSALVRAEEQFGNQQIPWDAAHTDGGPLMRIFLRELATILTDTALHSMRFVVSHRTIRAPWHTDNNDEHQPFRRFGITTGAPTLFLNVRDLPRWTVLGRDAQDYEEWRISTGVPDLATSGVVGPMLLPRGTIYSWGHDEWHRTPDDAREDDLMIVGELPHRGRRPR